MAVRVSESGATRLSESGATRVSESHSATDWPATLPQQFLIATYRDVSPSTVIRSEPERGPTINRRRSTAAVMPFAGDMVMTNAQKAEFDIFFADVALGGAADFMFPAQDSSGSIWDVRFTGEPERTRLTATQWQVSMIMEKLP